MQIIVGKEECRRLWVCSSGTDSFPELMGARAGWDVLAGSEDLPVAILPGPDECKDASVPSFQPELETCTATGLWLIPRAAFAACKAETIQVKRKLEDIHLMHSRHHTGHSVHGKQKKANPGETLPRQLGGRPSAPTVLLYRSITTLLP